MMNKNKKGYQHVFIMALKEPGNTPTTSFFFFLLQTVLLLHTLSPFLLYWHYHIHNHVLSPCCDFTWCIIEFVIVALHFHLCNEEKKCYSRIKGHIENNRTVVAITLKNLLCRHPLLYILVMHRSCFFNTHTHPIRYESQATR